MTYRAPMLKKIAENLAASDFQTLRNTLHPEVNRLAILLRRFEDTIEVMHPNDSPSAHARRLEKNGKELLQTITKSTTQMLNQIGQNVGELNAKAMKKAELTESENNQAQEIRSIVRRMSQSEQLKLLEQHDPVIMSALVDAHPFLTGVDEHVLKAHTEKMLLEAAPQEMHEAEELLGFIETIQIIDREASASVNEATDSEYVQNLLSKAEQDEKIHQNFISELGRPA